MQTKSGLENGTKNPEFFQSVHRMAQEKDMNVFEAMIWRIVEIMKSGGFKITDANISLGANQRKFNPGVEEFLVNLTSQNIKNYLLSSGSQAYLKQLKIAPLFEAIYASVLTYDENGEMTGIKRVMSAEEKSIALQEIAEQINGLPNDFSGIVYIGDGPTDMVTMDHIKKYGGKAILIQHENSDIDLSQINLYNIDLITVTDYTGNNVIAKYIKQLIES